MLAEGIESGCWDKAGRGDAGGVPEGESSSMGDRLRIRVSYTPVEYD